MSRVVLGAICGLVFGAIDVGIMLPMTFPDKRAAITAAFIARFGPPACHGPGGVWACSLDCY